MGEMNTLQLMIKNVVESHGYHLLETGIQRASEHIESYNYDKEDIEPTMTPESWFNITLAENPEFFKKYEDREFLEEHADEEGRMNKQELMGAIAFGKEVIEQYKGRGREVPQFLYERLIELYEQVISEQEG